VKDQLKATCRVNVRVDRAKGEVRVVVVDADSSDDDAIGDAALDLEGAVTSAGALQAVEARTRGGGGAWTRFRELWIALAIGMIVAVGLAMHRRRSARA
jgi:hypothetical protein